jgi:ABC-type sugar transport system substrate-binding protein
VAGIILFRWTPTPWCPPSRPPAPRGIPLVTCNGIVNSDLVSAKVLSNVTVVAGELEMSTSPRMMGGKGQIAILHGPQRHFRRDPAPRRLMRTS